MPEEIWKPVNGYEGKYWISNLGRIKNKTKILKPALKKEYIMSKGGYYQISLSNGKKYDSSTKLIHRLVAEAFIPNPDNLPQVNHIDHNPLNNCVENLEWCSAKYNSNHKRNNRKPLRE